MVVDRKPAGWAVMPKRSTAEQRRDVREAAIRRVMSLIELYAEMAESWLIAETFDAELVRRMLATRESVLALIEAVMPMPLINGELDEVQTQSRAVH
jgi:hypothetical protein